MDHLLNYFGDQFMLKSTIMIMNQSNLKEGLIRETLVSFMFLHTHLVSEKFKRKRASVQFLKKI